MHTEFLVGEWLVQPQLNTLTLADTNCRVRPKSIDVLIYLARHQGEVVSKEELLRTLWPDTFVTDDTLISCIGELRKAFGDSTRDSRVIQTIAKRGYRLLARVVWIKGEVTTKPAIPASAQAELIENDAEFVIPAAAMASKEPLEIPAVNPYLSSNLPGAKNLKLYAGAILALLILATSFGAVFNRFAFNRQGQNTHPSIRALAVLPFDNLGRNSEQEYFADSLTEALITALAQIEALKVISKNSAMQFRDAKAQKKLPEIAHQLGVDGIVEGTVQESADRVRVTVQLIDGATDKYLWTGTYDGNRGDILQLQGEITHAILSDLALSLSLPDQTSVRNVQSTVPQAYDAYLRGMYCFNKRRWSDAADYFEKATIADSNYALAHALLAESIWMAEANTDIPMGERYRKALSRARELDGNLAEVQAALGDKLFFEAWDWKAGEAAYRRAVNLNPRSVDAQYRYAVCLTCLGRFDDAVKVLEQILQVDPLSTMLVQFYGRRLINAHQYKKAVENYLNLIAIEPKADCYEGLSTAYARMGKVQEAIDARLIDLSFSGTGSDEIQVIRERARKIGLPILGQLDIEDAQKQLEKLNTRSRYEQVPPFDFGITYARLGKSDEAMKYFEQAFEQHSRRLPFLMFTVYVDSLRSDARFHELLRKTGLAK